MRFGAGFSLRCGQPDWAGSYVHSTSVYSLPATPGDVIYQLGEVSGGVEVSVDDMTTRLADEGALAEGELVFHPSAGRARLRRRIETVGDDYPTAVPGSLVAELTA